MPGMGIQLLLPVLLSVPKGISSSKKPMVSAVIRMRRSVKTCVDAGFNLLELGWASEERGMMAKMATKAGIMMNTVMDNTNSHITEMLIEGATMSVTTAEKLANHAEGKEDCAELVEYCRDWAKFEQNHIDALKKYL